MTDLHSVLQGDPQQPPPLLFDPDYVQRLARLIGGDDVPVLDGGEIIVPNENNENNDRRTRKRRLTLASVARAAKSAGLTILRVEFDRDGKISGVVTGKAGAVSVDLDDTTIPDRSEWN